MTSKSAGRVWFDAHITPHSAMSRRGLARIGAGLLAPAILFGAAIIAFGAWPASVFLGGEVLLAVAALYWCARRLSEQSERVLLTDDALIVEAWDQGRAMARAQLEPAWAHVERRMSEDYGCEALFVRARDRRAPIAVALSPAERTKLASALESALHQRKSGFAQRAV